MVFGTDRRVLTLAMARMADALGNSFLIIVLPEYIRQGYVAIDALVGTSFLGLEVTVPLLIGLVLSLFGLLNSSGQPFTGRLSDRTGKRRSFILTGLVIFGVASAAYPFVSSYWAVVLIRAFQGIGAAFTIPATIALVNDYAVSDRERGGNFGVFNTFRLIGFGFGPIIAGVVIEFGPYATPLGSLSGVDAAFAVAVAGAAVSFALVSLLIHDPEDFDAQAGEELSFRVFDRDGDGLDSVFALGVGTLFMALTIALFATLEGPIKTALNEGNVWFGAQFAAVVLANVVFQVPVGRASDRYGRKPFILAGFALLVPSVLIQGYVPGLGAALADAIGGAGAGTGAGQGGGDLVGPVLMLVFRALQGVAVALVFAPSLALAGDLAGSHSGTTLSVLTMAFGFGVALGPLVAGVLVRYGFAVPFAFGAALGVVALVLTYTQVDESLEPAGRAGGPGGTDPDVLPHDD